MPIEPAPAVPTYRAKAKLFVDNRLIQPGETFQTSLPPGEQWEALDDEGKARIAARPAQRRTVRVPGQVAEADKPRDADQIRAQIASLKGELERMETTKKKVGPASGDEVVIPDDWQDLKPEQRINLARQLGAPVKGTGAVKADEVIEAEVARRAKTQKAD